ncbi:hypothetical protein AGDE_07406 [Angomonas deanei]|uniref:PPR repeat, putative n=1 Tax=Angomonas deanei TaxID=59799 RepID=A0A7G2CGW5_9TRYP|nr:hypothetical protein AGDE_07406 [Angomonas deanei]CAD2219070.1 PPR repeat, putative [Angomonas deanei]|eukprot:EPY35378.1 hypothetical protein AGDE_07406 [Angomonas deanei]
MVGGVGTAQRQQQQPFSDEGSISVNAWEQQREREVDRLRMKQAEAERERAAERLVAEHRSLGLEWIQRRSRSFPSTKLEKGKEQLAKIYFSKSADDSLGELSRLAESGGSRSSSLHSTMALCIARQIREVDEAHRAEKFEKLEALLRQMKVPTDVITKSNMIAFHDEKFEAALGNLSQSSLGDLDAALVRKVSLHYLDKGLWEDAISVIEKNRNHLEENSGFQYLLLLKKCRFLDSPAKENTMAYAVKRLNELGRLGMEAKLYLALCETGTARKSTLMQLIDSSDATEVVYGELLKRCNPDDIPSVLEKMAKNGLDKEDPHILTALAYRAIDEHDPLAVFREIEQHTQNSPVVPGQLKAATRSAELFPSEEVLSLLVALLKRSSPASSYCVVFRVFALLYDQQRFDLILELYEHFKTEDNANFLNRFPNTVAFINAALIDKRLPPLSDLKPSDVDYRKAITGVAKEKESSTDSKDHLTSIIEKMLAYAKEKQWEEALKTLDTLQGLQAENDAALTLIYNCALSASVELPAVTLNTFDVMKARGVVCKPTTINTVLSSLSKSGDWKESLRFYESANSTEKDITTYLVLFSLLSKYNLWESAFSAYEDMRKSFNKPSSTVFNLAIGATNGNWSVMLKVFYDMLKVHGASVKENVLQQVVHTLEQNNRTSELVALEKE